MTIAAPELRNCCYLPSSREIFVDASAEIRMPELKAVKNKTCLSLKLMFFAKSIHSFKYLEAFSNYSGP
jgi:hypothetical protein